MVNEIDGKRFFNMVSQFQNYWLLPVNNFFLRVKTILTRPMRLFIEKVTKNSIFERTPPWPFVRPV